MGTGRGYGYEPFFFFAYFFFLTGEISLCIFRFSLYSSVRLDLLHFTLFFLLFFKKFQVILTRLLFYFEVDSSNGWEM